jgi:hypothetical protein
VEKTTERPGATPSSFVAGHRLMVAEDVRSRRIAGETVILHLETEQYFGLSGVGSRLWELLGHGTDVEHAVNRLADEYEMDAALVRADVHALLSNLMGSELVVAVPESGATT